MEPESFDRITFEPANVLPHEQLLRPLAHHRQRFAEFVNVQNLGRAHKRSHAAANGRTDTHHLQRQLGTRCDLSQPASTSNLTLI